MPLDITLTPQRSLSAPAFLILMFAIVAVSVGSGVLFYQIGAWPVSFFFGLDALLIYGAFRWNYADGAKREVIHVSRACIRVTQIDRKGRARYREWEPSWTRLSLTTDRRGGQHLALSERGDRTEIATFLNDEEREALGDMLSRALIEARGGARI
ncbi:MAG: DUF2244 domain-containing protein [Pseudomonadota bacterium]